MTKRLFLTGDPVPDFYCAATVNPKFYFGSMGGRYLVLCFYGSMAIQKNAEAIRFFTGPMRPYFDDSHLCFFGVCVDPADQKEQRVCDMLPGIRYFWDFEQQVSKLYGVMDDSATPHQSGALAYRSLTLILDPNLRVVAAIPLADLARHNQEVERILRTLPPVDDYAGVPITAPVLVIPRVFEPEFCRTLIELYESHGGSESGTMMEKDGYTVGKLDYSFKRRLDYHIEDETMQNAIRARIARRILPEVHKVFQYRIRYIERYIVACYDGEHRGFFRPHRDNNTKGTAHRRFACSINLNSEEFDGGNLRFPEFGSRTYRAPTGGAVVFSCSLLHEATPVTQGKRYATLPFFYDDEAAKLRKKNLKFLTEEVIDMNAANPSPMLTPPDQASGGSDLSSR